MREDLTASARGARWIDTEASGVAVPGESWKTRNGVSAAPRGKDLARIERAIDLRRLRYFVNIVAEGSFSGAAERLCVAQPALSHHVRELEAILGVTLLTRSVHGVMSTEAGRCLYKHALKILAKVGDAVAEVSAFNVGAARRVRICLDGPSASLLSAPLVQALRRRSLRLSPALVEASAADICKWIEVRRLDIGLVFDAPDSKPLIRQTLLTDRLYLVGPPDGADGDVTLVEVAKRPLILPALGDPLRACVERAARSANLDLNVAIEVDGISSTKKLIRGGVGFSVLPGAEVDDDHSLGLLQRRAIVAPHLEQTLFLCTARESKAAQEALLIRSLIPEIVREAQARTEGARGYPALLRSKPPPAVAFA